MKKIDLSSKRGGFFLFGDNLYVANDGRPFDRKGVIALCMPNLSGKGDPIEDDHADTRDPDWISELNQSQLDLYLNHRNRLQTDFKEEQSTIRQYAGRWVLELLQNIDDAIGPDEESKYIGTKGLGFLSVMEVADNPQIFSGAFSFGFSRTKNKIALEQSGLPNSLLENAPTFQIPWPAEQDTEVSELITRNFATVIKLQIKEDSLEDVKLQLQRLDHHFLLFSQNLDELTISIDGKSKSYRKTEELISGDREQSKTEIKIYHTENGVNDKDETWVRWQRSWISNKASKKRSSCMFCLPVKSNKCVPHSRITNVYNFYPTEQSSDIRGFLHISFDLSRDRKQFFMWGLKQDVAWNSKFCEPENKRLVDETKRLIVEDVLNDPSVPAETAIKTFASLNKHDSELVKKGAPLKRVQGVLISAIKSNAFLPRFGGGKTDLKTISIWENDFVGCLIENERIQDWNLAPKFLESCFGELERYKVDKLDSQNAISCLAEADLKSDNVKNRKKLSKLISSYMEEVRSHNHFFLSCFRNIKFLTDSDQRPVCLNDEVFVNENLACPSFFDTPKLSKASSGDLTKDFLENEKIGQHVKNDILECFISSEKDLFLIKFIDLLNRSSSDVSPEAFWKKNGFAILTYAFEFYSNFKEEFEECLNDNEPTFFVPGDGRASSWGEASSAFFSPSWLGHEKLKEWFNEYSEEDEFLLMGASAFSKKLALGNKKTSKKEKNDHKSKQKIKSFLLTIGVSETPAFRKVTAWETIKKIDPDYHKLVNDRFHWLYYDYYMDMSKR